MLFKILAGVLAVLLAAETAYMLTHRRSIHRFEPVAVEYWEGFVALDTTTERICRTVAQEPAMPSGDSSLDLIRKLPACGDIR